MNNSTLEQACVKLYQEELERVGWVRRLLRARRWYGADWWFAVLSGVLLIFIFSMGVFPGLYAPYDPRQEVGPQLLAPGQTPPTVLIISRAGGPAELADLSDEVRLGIVRGSQSAQVFREQSEQLQAELRAQGQTITLRPRLERYDDLAAALDGLLAEEVDAVIELSDAAAPLLAERPTLVTGASVTGAIQRAFVLGTNQIGQDVLSRLIWGTRTALLVGFAAAVFALAFGVPLGLAAGFWSGPLERALTLVMDSLYSFPGLILAVAITSVLGPGMLNIIFAIATLYIPTYYRIVRSQTLSIKEEMYVEAARSLGARPLNILFRYIFPNVIPSLVVIFSVNVADSILTGAGLSFLGLGLPPDVPDWGLDLAAGQDLMRQAPWLVFWPGVMIVITVLGFSMLGESLSEILNPKLREN